MFLYASYCSTTDPYTSAANIRSWLCSHGVDRSAGPIETALACGGMRYSSSAATTAIPFARQLQDGTCHAASPLEIPPGRVLPEHPPCSPLIQAVLDKGIREQQAVPRCSKAPTSASIFDRKQHKSPDEASIAAYPAEVQPERVRNQQFCASPLNPADCNMRSTGGRSSWNPDPSRGHRDLRAPDFATGRRLPL